MPERCWAECNFETTINMDTMDIKACLFLPLYLIHHIYMNCRSDKILRLEHFISQSIPSLPVNTEHSVFCYTELSKQQRLAYLGAVTSKLLDLWDGHNESEAWKTFKTLHDLYYIPGDGAISDIFTATSIRLHRMYKKNEFYYQDSFCKSVPKLLPTMKVVTVKVDGKNIPDAWLQDEYGNVIPVEVKLHDFNSAAKKQLERYIQIYHTNYGIAVGEKLTTSLPDNMFFISLSDIMSAA